MLPFVLFTVVQLGRKHAEIGGKNIDFFCRGVRSTDLKRSGAEKIRKRTAPKEQAANKVAVKT